MTHGVGQPMRGGGVTVTKQRPALPGNLRLQLMAELCHKGRLHQSRAGGGRKHRAAAQSRAVGAVPPVPPKGALRVPEPPAPLRPSSANSPKLTRGLCHTGGGGLWQPSLKQRILRSAVRSSNPFPPCPPPNPRRGPRIGADGLQQHDELPAPPPDSFSNKRVHVLLQPIAAIQLHGPGCCLTSFRLFDFQMTISCSPAASSRAPPPPHSNRPPSHSGSERSQLFPGSLIAAYFLADFCSRTRDSFIRPLQNKQPGTQRLLPPLPAARNESEKVK